MPRNTSKARMFVYLFHPYCGNWVTAGRLDVDTTAGSGHFVYAPSFLDSEQPVSIDPVNLPLLGSNQSVQARRYQGLHDAFRDAAPDAWGQLLLQREHGLSPRAHPVQYLLRSGNSARWGALAFGMSPKPNVHELSAPKLEQMEALCIELLAIHEQRPAVNSAIRRLLVQAPSMGGARPKGTVRDLDGEHWLIKPRHRGDAHDIPQVEHAIARWGNAAGLNFAKTQIYYGEQEKMLGMSVLASHRFDRQQQKRRMVLSAASVLGTHYPSVTTSDSEYWSYPRLALGLRQIGAPAHDLKELFGRMVFNALIGNDDDHPRNHAVVFDSDVKQWRLAPAYDVVPNLEMEPPRLAMQLSQGRLECNLEAILGDAEKFGFESVNEARTALTKQLGTFLEQMDVALEIVSDRLVKEMLCSRVTARAQAWM